MANSQNGRLRNVGSSGHGGLTAMVLKPAPNRPEDLARPNQIASLIPNRDCLDLDHHVWMHQRINPDGGEAWKFLKR
jgi:hypothetical protein